MRIAGLILLLWLTSCSSTRLSSEWRDPADDARLINKLAVVAVFKDAALSALVENEAMRRLPASAHPASARELGLTPDADIDALRQRLQQAGFDAAVVTRLVTIDERDVYHPPQTYLVGSPYPFSPYYRDFWHFYPYANALAVSPGYKTREKRYIVETLLYRLPVGKPVWSVVTESVNPESTLVFINEVVRLVQKQMSRAGLVN